MIKKYHTQYMNVNTLLLYGKNAELIPRSDSASLAAGSFIGREFYWTKLLSNNLLNNSKYCPSQLYSYYSNSKFMFGIFMCNLLHMKILQRNDFSPSTSVDGQKKYYGY